MARDADSYLTMLLRLFPSGKAWSFDPGTVMREVVEGESVEFGRIDGRVDDLLRERNTLTTVELLPEHEIDFGLTANANLAVIEREAALNAQLRALGGLYPDYYITVAAALGYTITIDEFTPAWCGQAACGQMMGDQKVIFYWRVNIHNTVFVISSVTKPIENVEEIGGDVLLADRTAIGGYAVVVKSSWDNLRELFEKIKPAHTVVIYQVIGDLGAGGGGSSTGLAFSNAFSNAFSAQPANAAAAGAFDTNFGRDFNINY